MTPRPRNLSVGRRVPALIALCGAVALGGLAHAEDIIVTTRGKRYVGTIVSETASKVRIKTVLHNIETTVELRRGEIASIEKREDPEPASDDDAGGSDDAPSEGEGSSAPSGTVELRDEGPTTFTPSASRSLTRGLRVTEAPAKREGVPMYLEIPLRGTFGEDIYPKGVGEALLWARENGVTDVVFRIESPGGAVWAAERIVELMNEQRGSMRYHALIERAISASIWPSFACDTISMAPRSGFGGAVAFRMDANTGSAEVDLKMNSIRMAEVVTEAEENGHPGQVVRAMMISDQELYAARPEGEQEWELLGSAPTDTSRYAELEALDTGESILTLTANQAEKFGIAPKLESERAEALRERLGYSAWDNAGPAGYELTEHYARACDDMLGKIRAQAATINSTIARYEAAQYIRPAIRALEQFKKDVAVYDRLTRQAQELDLGVVVSELDGNWRKFTSQEVERILKEMRRRLRGP